MLGGNFLWLKENKKNHNQCLKTAINQWGLIYTLLVSVHCRSWTLWWFYAVHLVR